VGQKLDVSTAHFITNFILCGRQEQSARGWDGLGVGRHGVLLNVMKRAVHPPGKKSWLLQTTATVTR